MIIDFLQTTRTREELTIALDVLREFKASESEAEWVACPFQAWVKLEQLEEFLDHLANGQALKDDTIAYMQE